MAKGMSMKVLLQLQTKEFQKGINSIKKQLNGFKNFMKSAFALGSVTMFGKQMIQVSKDFENAMAKVQAVSNATTEEFENMRKEAERLGSTTRYTATEAAGALENLTRNGMSAANATKALSTVLAMAQANSIELAQAADILTNTMNMFGLSVSQSTRISDVLSTTASHAATDINSLYEALVNAAPAAKVLGFSLEETSAAIGALAQRGVKGAEAGTKLRIALQKMADPKVIKKMQEQGIEIDEATIKAEGLYKTIEKLSKANLSLGQLGTIFDAKSAMALQLMISSLDDFEYMLDATGNAAGETARMFNQSVGSVQKELDTLKSMYEGLLISIGNQTKGVVKSVVRLLQNLITNFETVGGTIANIASVAVPLLTKRVITLGTTLKTMFTQAAAGAATMQAAMGGIVTIVATLVTWIGTALVGAWNRAHKEMREANAKMAEAKANADNLQKSVAKLKEKIGDGSDSSSLNSALKEAIKLFPEFAEAINNAKRIAAATGEWDKLKTLLQDIADLQELVVTREAKAAVANAKAKKIGNQMYNDASPMNLFNVNYKEFAAASIKRQFKDMGFTNDDVRDKMAEIAKILGSTPSGVDVVKEVEKYLDSYEITVNETLLADWLDKYTNTGYFTDDFDVKARRRGGTESLQETNKDIQALDSLSAAKTYDIAKQAFDNEKQLLDDSLKKREISQNEYQQKMYDAAQKFYDKSLEFDNLSPENKKEAESIRDLYPKPKQRTSSTGGGGNTNTGGSASSVKTDADHIADAIKDYAEGTEKLANRLAAGTITQEEYDSELSKLVDRTWEAITSFKNFKEILTQLNQEALGATLSDAYKGNRMKEAFDAGTKKLQEQFGELGKYWLPQKQERDERFDYAKSASEIAKEKVDIEFNFADGLDKLVKDLQAAIDHGEFDGIKEDAIDQLNMLKEAAKEASDQAETLQHKLNLSEAMATLDTQIAELKEKNLNNISSVANAFDQLYRGVQSISELMGDKIEWKGFEEFISLINFGVQVFETMKTVMEAVQTAENLMAKQKASNAAAEVAANQAVTASELEKGAAAAGAAAAEGAESVAGIPVVGPALAVAAAAAIAGAIIAAMGKFANGGIVGGSSTTGDHQLARVNSGELILNKAQQGTLYKAIASGNLGGGQVEFKIRGDALYGALQNYNRIRK